MSIESSKVTSSGEFGPPEGGVSRSIVPAANTSSSNDGPSAWCRAGHVEDSATAENNMRLPQSLRFRGEGGELEGVGEEGASEQAGISSPVLRQQSRPGPRCSKEKVGIGYVKGKKKDRNWNRKILPSSSEEETKEGKGEEEDEDYVPESPVKFLEDSRNACEGVRRKLRGEEEIFVPSLSKPKIVAVTTLEGPNRIRMESAGTKRGREGSEEEMEVEIVMGEDGEDVESRPSSRDSSVSRSMGDPDTQKGPTKKRRRGRPSIYPGHEGMYTAEKRKERAKVRELKILEKKALKFLDPKAKATLNRAESVDRKAQKILEVLQELPTPELNERALQAIEAIKKVASTSTNLKGAYVVTLWRTSEELTALSLAYSSRLRAKEGDKSRESEELERLRTELSTIRTEQALLGGENRRLRAQVAELRARVVQGETSAPPAPPPPESPKFKRRRRGRKERGKGEISSDSTSTDVEMECEMRRELSPEARRAGIRARREVREDIAKGAFPPAIRPAIQGRTKELDEGGGEKSVPLHQSTSPCTTKSTPSPPVGLTREEIVGLIGAAISQLLPQLGGRVAPTEGKTDKPLNQKGLTRKDPVVPVLNPPVGGVDGDGQGTKKRKKRKRKNKKGKGASVPQQGGSASKGTGSPPL